MKTKIKNNLNKIALTISIALLTFFVIGSTIELVQFNQVYKFQFQNVFLITPREKPLTYIKKAQAKAPAQMTDQQYLCHVFGNACSMAMAIATAENGTHACDRVNINTNNTLDIGYMQINTVHLKKGWKLTDMLNCHKNIDYAYQIYQAQGFDPWVTYTSGQYKKYLNN